MLSKLLCDKQGIPRVQRQTLSYQDIVKTTFNRFRQQAKLDLSVSIHILNSFNTLLHLKMPQELKKSLLAQAKLVYEDSSAAKLNHSDKQDLDFFTIKSTQTQVGEFFI